MSDTSAPLVTIITPTFDHRRYIGTCLESVLAQTEGRWEQIVVDDGSTDGTDSIVRAVGDPRIRLARHRHRGIGHLADAYNEGLAAARGEFVAVLEGDDYWPPDKLERQVPAFDDPDVVLSWGRAKEIDPDGRAIRLIPSPGRVRRTMGASRGAAMRALLEGNPIPSCTVMCRRSALLAVGGFHQPDGIPTVDLPTWLELCRVGLFAPSETILGCYRRHPSQVTRRMASEMQRTIGWATRYVASLPAAERLSLGVTIGDARRIERHTRSAMELLAGRQAARDGRRGEAVARLRSAARTGGAGTRLKALAALECLYSPVGLVPAEATLDAVRRGWRRLIGGRTLTGAASRARRRPGSRSEGPRGSQS